MADIQEMFGWGTPPYNGEVNGAELLDTLTGIFERHLVLPTGASTTISLWVMNTYVYKCGRFLPKLLVSSPIKGCGKTTALQLLSVLVKCPLPGSNMSPAIIYRTIDAFSPTLIMDEADTFLNSNEDMYGILNASHSKINAYVWRCVGEDHEPKPFNVFAPQAIGMIGHPRNDALLSRCIVINMKRKTQDEQITMFNANLPLWEELRGKLGKWAHDQQEALSLLEPKSLNSGDDR